MIARLWNSRWFSLALAVALLGVGQGQVNEGKAIGWFNIGMALLGFFLFVVRSERERRP